MNAAPFDEGAPKLDMGPCSRLISCDCKAAMKNYDSLQVVRFSRTGTLGLPAFIFAT